MYMYIYMYMRPCSKLYKQSLNCARFLLEDRRRFSLASRRSATFQEPERTFPFSLISGLRRASRRETRSQPRGDVKTQRGATDTANNNLRDGKTLRGRETKTLSPRSPRQPVEVQGHREPRACKSKSGERTRRTLSD